MQLNFNGMQEITMINLFLTCPSRPMSTINGADSHPLGDAGKLAEQPGRGREMLQGRTRCIKRLRSTLHTQKFLKNNRGHKAWISY